MSGNPKSDRKRYDRKRHNNVATLGGKDRLLACGHWTEAEHVVAGAVGRPRLYRCPEGCGLQKDKQGR